MTAVVSEPALLRLILMIPEISYMNVAPVVKRSRVVNFLPVCGSMVCIMLPTIV